MGWERKKNFTMYSQRTANRQQRSPPSGLECTGHTQTKESMKSKDSSPHENRTPHLLSYMGQRRGRGMPSNVPATPINALLRIVIGRLVVGACCRWWYLAIVLGKGTDDLGRFALAQHPYGSVVHPPRQMALGSEHSQQLEPACLPSKEFWGDKSRVMHKSVYYPTPALLANKGWR